MNYKGEKIPLSIPSNKVNFLKKLNVEFHHSDTKNGLLDEINFIDFIDYLDHYKMQSQQKSISFDAIYRDYMFGQDLTYVLFPLLLKVLEAIKLRAFSCIVSNVSPEDRCFWYMNEKHFNLKDESVKGTKKVREKASTVYDEIIERQRITRKMERWMRDNDYSMKTVEGKKYPNAFIALERFSLLDVNRILSWVKKPLIKEILGILSLKEAKDIGLVFASLRGFRNQVTHEKEVVFYAWGDSEELRQKMKLGKEFKNSFTVHIATAISIGFKLELDLQEYIIKIKSLINSQSENSIHSATHLVKWIDENFK